MYELITVETDRAYGHGTYRWHTINFTGRLVQLIEDSGGNGGVRDMTLSFADVHRMRRAAGRRNA